MMRENIMERKVPDILELIRLTRSYLYTLYAFIIHPARSFSKIKESSFFNPNLFFIINIIVTYYIFRTPEPLWGEGIKMPFVNEPILLSGALIRYVFGVIVLLTILNLLLKPYKISAFSKKIFGVICYASAIFIPIAFFEEILNNLSGGSFFDLITSFFSTGQFKISSWHVVIFCFTILADIVIIWWWWQLFSIGIKKTNNLSDKNLSVVIRKSFLFFTGIQVVVIIISTFIVFGWWLSTPIAMLEVKELVSGKNANYLKAAALCDGLAKDIKIPPVYKYRAKVRAVAYKLSTLLVDKEDLINVRLNILDEINKEHYPQAEKMLADIIDRAIKKKEDSAKPHYFYLDLRDELKEAHEYRNLPKFSDVPPDSIGIYYRFNESPMPILFPPIF